MLESPQKILLDIDLKEKECIKEVTMCNYMATFILIKTDKNRLFAISHSLDDIDKVTGKKKAREVFSLKNADKITSLEISPNCQHALV